MAISARITASYGTSSWAFLSSWKVQWWTKDVYFMYHVVLKHPPFFTDGFLWFLWTRHIFIPPTTKPSATKLWGGYTGIGLSVRPSVCRRNGFRALDSYPYHLVTISHIWTTHRRKMFPIDFEVKRSKVKHTGHHKKKYSFRALVSYPYHLESPYHTYRLPMGWKCSLSILRSKGQRSSTLEIKVEIQFPGSRPLSLPPKVTISHI
jgi:hypothetical protein